MEIKIAPCTIAEREFDGTLTGGRLMLRLVQYGKFLWEANIALPDKLPQESGNPGRRPMRHDNGFYWEWRDDSAFLRIWIYSTLRRAEGVNLSIGIEQNGFVIGRYRLYL